MNFLTSPSYGGKAPEKPKTLLPLGNAKRGENFDRAFHGWTYSLVIVRHSKRMEFHLLELHRHLLSHEPSIDSLVEIDNFTNRRKIIKYFSPILVPENVVVPKDDSLVAWLDKMFDRVEQSAGTTFELRNRAEPTLPNASSRCEENATIPLGNQVPVRSQRFCIWKKTNMDFI